MKKKILKWLEYGLYACAFVILLCLIISRTHRSPVSVVKEDAGPVTDAQFIEKRIVLDSVPLDTVVSMKYRIINTGDDTLRVLNVNPDCTCTDYRISAAAVPPQDTTDVVLVFNTHNRLGENKINAIVKLNTPEKVYKITAIIKVFERE